MGWFRKRIDSWLDQPDKYHSNDAVAKALVWAFSEPRNTKINLSLFECLLHTELSDIPALLSRQEQRGLFEFVERARSTGNVTKDSFPQLTNNVAIKRIGRWISNITRSDLAHMPKGREDLTLGSFICPKETEVKIAAIFNAFGYKTGAGLVLPESIYKKASRLGELIPYMIGKALVMCPVDIPIEDTPLVPRTLSGFYYFPKLAMVTLPDIQVLIVRHMPDAIAQTQVDKIDPRDLEARLRREGWETQTVRIDY